jgi:3-deoxy-7-phosphoheptulonate synthase
MSMAAVAAGADGIIVEVHNEPESAICDGPQAVSTEVFADYAEQLRQVAAVAGKELARA